MEPYYYRLGEVYDEENKGLIADITFYLRKAREYGGPILELACGTGRLSIPLAREGFDVTGLDISKPMLHYARKKAAGLDISWVEADCRDFKMDREFAFIFLGYNSLSHLHDLDSLERCFSRVREHLRDDGHFAIDVFNPNLTLLSRDPDKRFLVNTYEDPLGRGMVSKWESNEYDAKEQVNHIRWYYELGNEEFIEKLDMRIFFPQELDALLKYNGFTIEEKYGDFEGSTFNKDSLKQIVVCRKK